MAPAHAREERGRSPAWSFVEVHVASARAVDKTWTWHRTRLCCVTVGHYSPSLILFRHPSNCEIPGGGGGVYVKCQVLPIVHPFLIVVNSEGGQTPHQGHLRLPGSEALGLAGFHPFEDCPSLFFRQRGRWRWSNSDLTLHL